MWCCMIMFKTRKSHKPELNARPVQTIPVRRRGRQSYQSSYAASWDTVHKPSRGLTPSYYGSPHTSPTSSVRFNNAGDAFDDNGESVGRSRLPSASSVWAY